MDYFNTARTHACIHVIIQCRGIEYYSKLTAPPFSFFHNTAMITLFKSKYQFNLVRRTRLANTPAAYTTLSIQIMSRITCNTPAKVGIKSCRCARECLYLFVHAFRFEL